MCLVGSGSCEDLPLWVLLQPSDIVGSGADDVELLEHPEELALCVGLWRDGVFHYRFS